MVSVQFAFKIHWRLFQLLFFYLLASLLITVSFCFYYRVEMLFFFTKFLIKFNKKFIFTKLTTGFWIYFKLSFLTAFYFLIPLILYFSLFFIVKSFFQYQIKLLTLFFSLIYISLLNLLVLFSRITLPKILDFFLSFEQQGPIIWMILEARIDEYLIFVINFILFLIVILFIPLILLIVKVFIWTTQPWNHIRKFTYSGAILLLLILAPPDPTLQIFLLVPLIISLEIIFLVFYIFEHLFNLFSEESRIRTYDEN